MRKIFTTIAFLAIGMAGAYADTDNLEQFYDHIEGKLCYAKMGADSVELKKTTLIEDYAAGKRELVNVRIPSQVTFGGKTYPVARIADNAFRDCRLIDTVFMGEGLKQIGEAAFEGCTNMRHVELPYTLTEIHARAFSGCGLLPMVGIPYSLTFIGNSAFEGCKSLQAVRFPSQVEEIGPSVFKGCDNLVAVNVDEANPYMASVDGVLYNRGLTNLICCPTARKAAVVLPQTVTIVSWPFSPEMKLACISCYSPLPPLVKAAWPESMKQTVLFLAKRLMPIYQQDSNWQKFLIKQY